MTRIYSNRVATPVLNIKNVLASYDIETVMKGESLAGGGVGELPVWIELWLADEDRLDEAREIVEEEIEHTVNNSHPVENEKPWTCPNYGEKVDAEFALCRSCGAEQPAE